MKNKKKILFISLLMIILLSTTVFAAQVLTKLEVIKEEAKQLDFTNDVAVLTKEIVSSSNDEVTIELKLTNTLEEKETEVILLVDNSSSMALITDDNEIRREIVSNAMQEFSDIIFEKTTNVKIGLVRFSDNSSVPLNSAVVMAEPTLDQSVINSAIYEFDNLVGTASTNSSSLYDQDTLKKCEGGTNIDAGLKVASDLFSSDVKNKVIILLTDGVPTNALSGSSASLATKNRLITVENSGILTISLMAGMIDENGVADSRVTEIFGTTQNPTAGKFYDIDDASILGVVQNDILTDVLDVAKNTIENIVLDDYFPSDILENFDFKYIGNPSNGTVSELIDGKISWNIGELENGETATVEYTLTLKENFSQDIVGEILPTNEKIDVNYVFEQNLIVDTMLDSPSVKLIQTTIEENDDGQDENGSLEEEYDDEDSNKEETSSNTDVSDDTVSNSILPETGRSIAFIISITLVAIATIYMNVKKKEYIGM